MAAYLPAAVSPGDARWLGRAASAAVEDHRRLHRAPRVALYPGGCRASGWTGSTVRPPAATRRGVIRGFTGGASRRLRLRLCSFEWAAVDVAYFVVTYPNKHPVRWQSYKRDLDVFLKRLERQWPGALGVLWRLEFQQRGAAHYNILAFWRRGQRPAEPVWKAMASFLWLGTIGALDDPAARKYGVRGFEGERYESGGLTRLLAYIGGEMSKKKQSRQIDSETGESLQTGRCWGVRNFAGRAIPTAELGEVELTEAQWAEFCERVNRRGGRKPGGSWYLRAIGPEWGGFTIFADPETLLELLGLGANAPGELGEPRAVVAGGAAC